MTDSYTARRAHYLQKILRPFPFRRHVDWKKIHAVVFESDDWGFCGEGKNRESNERLSSLGYDLDNPKLRASSNNTLENSSDLNELFSILLSHSDSIGRPPVFTANFVVTNPDFHRIRDGHFSEYHALPISSGFPESWNSGDRLRETWGLGIDKQVWMPEFHGYSHFNYRNWLAGLRAGDKKLKDFFEEAMITSSRRFPTVSEYLIDPSRGLFADFDEQLSVIRLGCAIFRSTFGYNPSSTIPPHDLWDANTEKAFLKADLRFIQSERTKFSSALGFSLENLSSAWNGVKSTILLLGPLVKLFRSVRLELNDHESAAADDSEYLFRIGSPVVVGTHRVNYVSGVNSDGASSGRRRIDRYLKRITENALIAEHLVFLTTSELFQIYTRGYSSMKYGEEILVRNYTSGRVQVLKSARKRYTGFDLTYGREVDFKGDNEENRFLHSPSGTTISFRPDSTR